MRFRILFLLMVPISLFAQKSRPPRDPRTPTGACSLIPGMTPPTAIAVCGATSFHQTSVTSCTGPNITPSPCPDIITSDNSFWYKFHCYAAGVAGLGFTIKPDVLSDDFDWALFDVTGHANVNDVYTDGTTQVSINISGLTGITGCTPAGTSNINCAGSFPQVNKLAAVQAGHDYLLMVTNWSNSGQGYVLAFNGGDAVIVNNQPPTITSAVVPGCDNSVVRVIFSKDILCNSVTPTGSEFIFTPGTPAITNITSACSSGSSSITQLDIHFAAPLTPGNYTITLQNGSDGNTFVDPCGVQVDETTTNVPLVIPSPLPVTVSAVNFTGCAPTVLDVTLTKPVWCTSVTPGGSEFSITPGNPAIASVQSACSSGGQYASVLHIVLQNPLPHGNYQLNINAGADGNTFTDTCGNNLAPVSIPLNIPQTTVAPVIQSIGFNECHPDRLVVTFNKPVNCASLSANGSEFVITPGSWPIASVSSSCGPLTYTNTVTLTLQNKLPGGLFDLTINNGADGNTLSDTCYAFIGAGYVTAFTTTQAPAPKFDSVQFDKCNPAFVKVFYNHPIFCNTISPDGSDYFITGPSGVTIAAATPDAASCTSFGFTHWVSLQFSAPINVPGTYLVHNKVGNDGNGMIDTCNASQNIAETIAMNNVLVKPNAAFNTLVQWGCKEDTVVFSHPGGAGVNSWVWTFPDGTVLNGQTVSRIFPVNTPFVSVKLAVDNGFCNDTITQSVTLGNVFHAGFSSNPVDTFCINTPVNFTDTSSGAITAYLWKFGDLTQYSGQTPPAHIYTVFSNYNVQLIVTDNHGCRDTATHVLHVTASPLIDFTGLRPQYCTDNKLVLTRRISPNIDSYVWDNGDGATFQNKPIVEFIYPREGVYTITLTGNDKYCGPAKVMKTVPVYAVPSVALGSDTVLCPGDRLFIGVPANPAYNYTWNTGASASQIYTDLYSRTYKLVADNHGCNASDEMYVKVLKVCLIRVPGAFTPNGDGTNDRLGALNADLCKNFSFSVYNRGGELLFSTHNPMEFWDGRYKGVNAETGTYVWTLTYTDPWTGKAEKQKGTTVLLR